MLAHTHTHTNTDPKQIRNTAKARARALAALIPRLQHGPQPRGRWGAPHLVQQLLLRIWLIGGGAERLVRGLPGPRPLVQGHLRLLVTAAPAGCMGVGSGVHEGGKGGMGVGVGVGGQSAGQSLGWSARPESN